jgi:hypothetical protein
MPASTVCSEAAGKMLIEIEMRCSKFFNYPVIKSLNKKASFSERLLLISIVRLSVFLLSDLDTSLCETLSDKKENVPKSD